MAIIIGEYARMWPRDIFFRRLRKGNSRKGPSSRKRYLFRDIPRSENRACTYCTAMACLTTSGKRQDYGHDCGRMPVNRMGDITITGIFFPPLSLRTRIRGTKLNVGNANREQYEAPQEGKETTGNNQDGTGN